jgi:hypothetical protein
MGIFYHFTAKRFLKSIKRHGITRGMLLMSIGPPTRMKPNWQWVTKNPDPANQEWAISTGRLPYKRNEARITLEIPDNDLDLKPWSQVRFLVPEVAEALSAYGDPENWWLYNGHIPKEWIKDIKITPPGGKNPGQTASL